MKNIFKRKFWIGTVVILIAGTFIYGCEDFLTQPPQGSLDANTLANASGVEATLIAAYRSLDGPRGGLQGGAVSNWAFSSITTDDAYKGTEATDDAVATQMEQYNWSTGGADGRFNETWGKNYEGVNRANSTIRLLNQVLENQPGEISEADADGIRGEAIFLRAHYHFDLWQKFVNIPYYTEEDEDFAKSNQGVDVVSNLIADLDEAISLLPDSPRNGDDGRASSWVAKAYKGRIMMYAAGYLNDDTYYTQAIPVLEDVVNNGPFELEENYHHVWTGFSDLYNGTETIWAYQASSNDGQANGDNANFGERLNFPHSGSPFGCCGFHQPAQNLVNFFKVDGSGLPLAMDGAVDGLTVFDAGRAWNDQDGEFDGSQNTVPVDPRLDWTVGRDDVPYKDWGLHEAEWIRQESFGGPYSPKKNVHEQNSDAEHTGGGWVTTQQNSVRIHILRYAEVMLLLAEAYVETGNSPAAEPLVNEIRARAGVAGQGPGDDRATIAVPIDDPSITWADYEIGQYSPASFADADFARAAVRAERRLELAMEGTRLFDLRRWGILEPTLNNYVAVEQNRREYLQSSAEVTDRYYTFPLPTVQIELSTVEGERRLEQNEGW
ncbi:MAG: RagB/SusD family nutrient uptake outer membrane protein [Balneolaceae bacterium]